MIQQLFILLVLSFPLFAAGTISPACGFQERGGRDPGPSTTREKDTDNRRKTEKIVPVRIPSADLTIILTHEYELFLDGQPIPYRRSDPELLFKSRKLRLAYDATTQSVTLKGLKPDAYIVTASSRGYQDYSRLVPVTANSSNVVTVTLKLQPGFLTVSPGVSGGRIVIINRDNGASLGPYTNRVVNAEIVSGPYRVSVSKEGYLTTSRDITVRPGETVYLEPPLEPKPVPTPEPTPAPTIPIIPPSVSVRSDGKYLIFRVVGTSGEVTRQLGTIVAAFDGLSGTSVQGVLPGVPCRVNFFRLENIAESSLVETPGPSNRWSTIVIRIRPKDKKRPIRFAINWSLLASFD